MRFYFINLDGAILVRFNCTTLKGGGGRLTRALTSFDCGPIVRLLLHAFFDRVAAVLGVARDIMTAIFVDVLKIFLQVCEVFSPHVYISNAYCDML